MRDSFTIEVISEEEKELMQNLEIMDMLIWSIIDFYKEAINSPDSVKHICWLSWQIGRIYYSHGKN